MKSPVAHMKAIETLEKWRAEAIAMSEPEKYLINPVILYFDEQVDNLTLEIEEAIKKGDVILRDVLYFDFSLKTSK